MYAALSLEWIGHDDPIVGWLRKPWVAEVTDWNVKELNVVGRIYLDGKLDYIRANSIGSRGVVRHFVLEPGKYYEVQSWVSWKSTDHYLCKVTPEGKLLRVSRVEMPVVSPRASSQSASTS